MNDLMTRVAVNGEMLVHVDSKHPAHAMMYKTLDLLSITTPEGVVYFVVEGCAEFCSLDELRSHHQYFYEEHTCPTNFIRIEAIVLNGDDDPHGVFAYVDSAWLTEDYVDAQKQGAERDYLFRVFPQMRK